MKRASKVFRVFYLEEPVLQEGNDKYEIKLSKDGVFVVTPQLDNLSVAPFDSRVEAVLKTLFENSKIEKYLFWYYTPMMLELSKRFAPKLIVYDCMDQLSAFKNANSMMEEAEKELLSKADLVFTGGKSLYDAKKDLHENVSCCPSSIDYDHFAKARNSISDPEDQARIPHPRLGFFGVVDERFDIELLREAAELRPDFNFVIIGPVVKIDPETLPRNENIHYLGMKQYDELPGYISNWDIALLLFALNESTRYISPTKTPEYLAAGLPVISTAIKDVVSTYGETGLAAIIETSEELTKLADSFLQKNMEKERIERVDEFLKYSSWDATWNKMNEKINTILEPSTIKILSNV